MKNIYCVVNAFFYLLFFQEGGNLESQVVEANKITLFQNLIYIQMFIKHLYSIQLLMMLNYERLYYIRLKRILNMSVSPIDYY